jgi:hypothetical protein
MSGIFLGLIGGVAISVAMIVGALFAFFDLNFNKEFFTKLKLDLFLGIILLMAAISLVDLKFIEKNIIVGMSAFIVGIIFFVLSRISLQIILETVDVKDREEKDAVMSILTFILKNVLVGFVTGTIMNITHSGEGHSLLTVLSFYSFFAGTSLALCFLVLGNDLLMVSLATLFITIFTLVSALFGGYVGLGSQAIISLVMIFTGGALMATALQETFSLIKNEFKKGFGRIELGPSFISVIGVMLIFIVWKELL